MAIQGGFDPANYNDASGTGFTLGEEYTNGDGNVYRFLKTADAVNVTNGMVVEWASTTAYTVTADRAGGSSIGRIPAGVAMGSITATRYGFFLVRGRHPAVLDAANAATTRVKCITHATADGDAAPATAYTDCWFGVALANAAGGSFPCEVNV